MEYTEAEAEELKRNAEVGDILFPEQHWSDGQYCSCSSSSQAPLSVSIAGAFLPLRQPSSGLHFLLSFAPHFFQDSKQNGTKTEIHPDHLMCSQVKLSNMALKVICVLNHLTGSTESVKTIELIMLTRTHWNLSSIFFLVFQIFCSFNYPGFNCPN